MRRVVRAGAVSLVAVVAAAIPAWADPGDLDPGFGGTGHVSAVVAGNQDGTDVAVRPSGRVLVVSAGGTVVQFLANGDPDNEFGSGGVVTGPPGVEINAMALDPLGNLVLTGARGTDLFVERLLPNGDPDPAFGGGDGRVTTAFSKPAFGLGVTIGPHGRIAVTGGVGISQSRMMAARYLDNGHLDHTFSSDGKVKTLVLGNDSAEDIAVADDGSVVIAGTAAPSATSPRSFGIVRYRPNGHLDPTFSGDGRATVRIGTTSDGFAVLIQPNGAVVVGGNYFHPTIDWALARFTHAGRLDHSFSGDGKLPTAFGSGTNNFAGIVRQQSGDLIAAGTHQDGGDHSVVLVRYLPNGSVDSGFGTAGRVVEDLGDHPSCRGIERSPHGKVVIGATVDGLSSDGDLGAARFLAGA
ncbi:MAG: hypothetical protein ACJ77A_07995 [Actinomycetota bacterium]